jgi:hypothetical protein
VDARRMAEHRVGARVLEWDRQRVTRRGFITGAATLVAAGASTGFALKAMDAEPVSEDGLVPLSMAMHVHASASEGPGSMLAQLVQAAKADVDVLWWTEHDHRMAAYAAPTSVKFDGLAERSPDMAPWTWSPRTQGAAIGIEHDFITNATNPEIGDRTKALRLSVQAPGAKLCTHTLSGQAENLLNRTSLAGLTIKVDIRPTSISALARAAVNIVTSYRPRNGGQPEGIYTLSYRVGGRNLPGVSKVVAGNTALIERSAPLNEWTTLTLNPELDLARLWPGVDGQDASMHEFSISVSAHDHATASVFFAGLRFDRANIDGNEPLAVQAELMQRYAPQFPNVRQIQALEVSLTTPHLGWYGGRVSIPDHTGMAPLPSKDPAVAAKAVKFIHDRGGLASYCHPFGTSVSALSPPEQETLRVARSAELIANRALGCDLLEVGYRLRGGCNLAQHESVWDNCSRNMILLTGIGVSDDHAGENWLESRLNFVTWAWAENSTEEALLAALRRGRVYFGDLARFRGALDIRIDGRSAMGTVSVSSAKSRKLSILATGVPEGGSIELVRGTVDLAGPADTDPHTQRVALPASELTALGELAVIVDTSAPRFVRFVVKDGDDLEVGFSNPVWLLNQDPKRPIPAARQLDQGT